MAFWRTFLLLGPFGIDLFLAVPVFLEGLFGSDESSRIALLIARLIIVLGNDEKKPGDIKYLLCWAIRREPSL